jgi:sorbitol-specific phosphotransferase system component IIA
MLLNKKQEQTWGPQAARLCCKVLAVGTVLTSWLEHIGHVSNKYADPSRLLHQLL